MTRLKKAFKKKTPDVALKIDFKFAENTSSGRPALGRRWPAAGPGRSHGPVRSPSRAVSSRSRAESFRLRHERLCDADGASMSETVTLTLTRVKLSMGVTSHESRVMTAAGAVTAIRLGASVL